MSTGLKGLITAVGIEGSGEKLHITVGTDAGAVARFEVQVYSKISGIWNTSLSPISTPPLVPLKFIAKDADVIVVCRNAGEV